MHHLKKYSTHILLVLLHMVFASYAFWLFWKHPDGVVFSTYGDGMKNNFTLLSYVKAPVGDGGLFKYNAMAYPFGEYVYYTDNTPLLSIPLRFFCQHIFDVSGHAFAINGIFVIGNIILCGLLVYMIFGYLFREKVISFLLALVLPWTTMQGLRLERGHYSLSYSSLILLAMGLLILWHKRADDSRKRLWVLLLMVLLSVASFLCHGYLFAIITIFTASMLFFYGCLNFRTPNGKITIAATVVYVFAALGLTLWLVHATDKYLPLRQDFAMGYDWMDQKIRFSSLFNHYVFHTVYFPAALYQNATDAETAGYLGNVGLYFVLVCGILAIVSRPFRQRIATAFDFFKDPVRASILLGSLVMLFISFGERYNTSHPKDDGYDLYNVFNPFLYLHFFTRTVEQFRSLERFVFPFYFGFYVLAGFMIVALYRTVRNGVKVVIIVLIVFLGGAELLDVLVWHHRYANHQNLLDPYNVSLMRLPEVDMNKYQAMVPIPFFCGGSEDYNNSIDADQAWALLTDQFILKSGLPSMSFGLSRVPPTHSISLLNCLANDSMDEDMKSRMNNKPVLVMYHKKLSVIKYYAGVPTNENAAILYWKICDFPKRNHLQAVDSFGDLVFYDWYPKR